MSTQTPQLRTGEQLASTGCTVKVVVVRAPSDATPQITCGGAPLGPVAEVTQPPAGGAAPQTQIGKRYVNADDTVELLCTSSGSGELACDGTAMTLKAAKSLPASD
ncbi:hypothetical protein AAFP35_13930 [Gordonia sp. CPCC 206044]|uniref:hypothetical protein n=1 Tax=Gordonia sp. CPCC 206044 TaxID=3140793 RepID=UPI003AF3B1A1